MMNMSMLKEQVTKTSLDRRIQNESRLHKNKFTASRTELGKNEGGKREEEICEEVEEVFFKAERKHGISSTSYELKRVVQKVLKGEKLVFVKANLVSNHNLLYDAFSFAGKKIATLFLHPALETALKKVLPKGLRFITMEELPTLTDIDVLFIDQCELLDDLGAIELKKIRDCLERLQCSKVLVASLMAYRAFVNLRDLIKHPFPGIALPGLKVKRYLL